MATFARQASRQTALANAGSSRQVEWKRSYLVANLVDSRRAAVKFHREANFQVILRLKPSSKQRDVGVLSPVISACDQTK